MSRPAGIAFANVLALAALTGCQPPPRPVDTPQAAIAVAKAQLRGRPDALGHFTARRAGDRWVVTSAPSPGNSHTEGVTLTIDARTGRLGKTYSDEITSVAIIKP